MAALYPGECLVHFPVVVDLLERAGSVSKTYVSGNLNIREAGHPAGICVRYSVLLAQVAQCVARVDDEFVESRITYARFVILGRTKGSTIPDHTLPGGNGRFPRP